MPVTAMVAFVSKRLLPPEVAAAGEERERGDEGKGHHRRLVRIFPEAGKRLARLLHILSYV